MTRAHGGRRVEHHSSDGLLLHPFFCQARGNHVVPVPRFFEQAAFAVDACKDTGIPFRSNRLPFTATWGNNRRVGDCTRILDAARKVCGEVAPCVLPVRQSGQLPNVKSAVFCTQGEKRFVFSTNGITNLGQTYFTPRAREQRLFVLGGQNDSEWRQKQTWTHNFNPTAMARDLGTFVHENNVRCIITGHNEVKNAKFLYAAKIDDVGFNEFYDEDARRELSDSNVKLIVTELNSNENSINYARLGISHD